MNFLRDKSLKRLGLYIVLTMILIFSVQYVVITTKIENLHEAERKIDYARVTQMASVQLALQSQAFLQGKAELSPKIATGLHQQDARLKILGEGGRMEGKAFFIKPVSRLARITYTSLVETWEQYKESTVILLTQKEITEEVAPASPPDSLGNVFQPPSIQKENPAYKRAKVNVEAEGIALSSWFDKLISDLEDEVIDHQKSLQNFYILFVLLNTLVMVAAYVLFYRYVLKPLQTLEINTANNTHTLHLQENEIGKIGIRINETIENLQDATDFVTAIGEGKLTLDYKHSLDSDHTTGKNKLADSLIEMQAKLQQLNEEDRKRQWVNEGVAKFADILRSSNDNLAVLCDKVIAALAQYTQSNQGGLYILNDNDQHNKFLELVSLFAFDVKKFEQRKIKLGEGILGQTFLEKETTYLTDLPQDYIRITSGLGDASPHSILMVPLKVNEDVYGMVELASFKEYAPYVIAFVEKLGETIASTLASVKAAEKNRQLIEQFQQQTEEMRAQEEEMRQNMEELQATQEEITRKEHGYIDEIASLQEQISQHASTLASTKTKTDLAEQTHALKMQELESRLAQKPNRTDDWALAEEVEQTLKMNLEALKITQEELEHKTGRN